MTKFHRFIDYADDDLMGLVKKIEPFEEIIRNERRSTRTAKITSFLLRYFRSAQFQTIREVKIDNFRRNLDSRRGGRLDLQVKQLCRTIDIEIDSTFKLNSLKKLIFVNICMHTMCFG